MMLLLSGAARAAEPITIRVAMLPLKEGRDIGTRAQWAIVERFMELHPDIRVEGFRGIEAPGLSMEGPLMAMAGGVAPEVLYVNFRISDSYIQQQFLYPLDDYVAQWAKEEDLSERIYPQVWPVIKRPGPDGKTHVWAVPYSTLVMALVYRKDLFREAGLDPDRPPQNWDELFEYAKKLTVPEKGQYGINLIGGPSAAWYFIDFLWSAGGDSVRQDKDGQWRAVFNDEHAVAALKFYQKLLRAKWTRNGKEYTGVAYRGTEDYTKWNLGQIGINFMYLSDDLMANVNPNLVGIAPMPVGPTGMRGSELNCPMFGINATIKDKRVRDAAWEYIKFFGSEEAQRIKAKVYVEGGYARFIAPKYLRKFGYERYLREVPPGWEQTLNESLKTGKPEPYGRNCEMVYVEMTPPLDAVAISDRTDYQALLDRAVKHANERMIGIIPPAVERTRMRVSTAAVIALVAIFLFLFRQVFRSFSADIAFQHAAQQQANRERWLRHWKLNWPAYVILLPALASVLIWQYYPLARGSVMSFQDYKLVAPSKWVGLENFSHVLFEPRFWRSMFNSTLYMVLALGLGFGAPILLALMLHEVPRGKILLRTLYYLPAATTSLVTLFLWKQFYDPSSFGFLNKVLGVMHVPPQTWLQDPKLAMLSVIIPGIWAGVGPGCIIYLAALKSIPEEYYEAADLDGAGIWHKIRFITLPYLKPLIIINFVGAFVGAFRSFDAIFAMTGGGPLFSTHVAGLEIWYNAFLYLNFGYAVSAAWILGSLLVGFTVWQLRILSKIEFRTAQA
jgi:ABC-type sugar transport system permease subunit/ABC-type glycerol-3-phosphate transport system substrate-binding protein